MNDTINLHDLPEEEVKLVREFVAFLKRKSEVKQASLEDESYFNTLGVESFAKDWENSQDAIYDNWKELYHIHVSDDRMLRAVFDLQ